MFLCSLFCLSLLVFQSVISKWLRLECPIRILLVFFFIFTVIVGRLSLSFLFPLAALFLLNFWVLFFLAGHFACFFLRSIFFSIFLILKLIRSTLSFHTSGSIVLLPCIFLRVLAYCNIYVSFHVLCSSGTVD